MLIGVTNTFALVWLWGTESADFRSRLAHSLLVDTLDHDFGLGRCLSRETFSELVINVVR